MRPMISYSVYSNYLARTLPFFVQDKVYFDQTRITFLMQPVVFITDAFHFLPYDYTEKSSYEKSNEILPLHVAKLSKLNSIFA